MLSRRIKAARLHPNESRGKMKTFPLASPSVVVTTLLVFACSGTNSGGVGTGGSPTGGIDSTGTGSTNGGVENQGDSTNSGSGTQAATTLQNGGTSAAGGTNATSGSANGGKSAAGGMQAAGGSALTGGNPATGGNVTLGGTSTTVATQLTGGVPASGGSLALGGDTSTAGKSSTGASSFGGSNVTGGTTGAGGRSETGGLSAIGGAASTGGSSSTATCTMSGGLSSTSGQLTCYYFGQGPGPVVCNGANAYKLNCGYCGSEGSASGNACNASHNDKVQNISTGDYFAAVPNWGQGENCGLCLSITYQSKTIVATVIDNCASCGSGHVDLSPSAGVALGMGTGTGQTENPTSGVTWKSVACPVGTTPIVAGYNGDYSGQIYFQNVAFPVASAYATIGGTKYTAQLTNGMWDFGMALYPGDSITLTNTLGHTVSGKIGSNGAGIGVQFPTTC